MQTLIYFLLWAGIIFLMLRFGCGSHVMGHGHGHTRHRENADAGAVGHTAPLGKDIDPVCGMIVDTSTATAAVERGHTFYFCSTSCRERFEAAPERYIERAGLSPQP